MDEAVVRAWIVGFWGEDGDCRNAIAIFGDNTFDTFDGNSGTWSLEGDRLTLDGNARRIEVQVALDGRDAMTMTGEDGISVSSTRCEEF